MEENKKNKQELLDVARKLTDKHAELKETISGMLDEYERKIVKMVSELKPLINDMLEEMDRIELDYNKIIEEIKKK